MSDNKLARWLLGLPERPAVLELVSDSGSSVQVAVHDVRYWAAAAEKRVEAAAATAAATRAIVARRADGIVVDTLLLTDAPEPDASAQAQPQPLEPSSETARAYAQAHADTRSLLIACSEAGRSLLDQAIEALRQASSLRDEASRERQQVARRLEVVQRASAAAAAAAPSDEDIDARVAAALERAIPALIAQHAPTLLGMLKGEEK